MLCVHKWNRTGGCLVPPCGAMMGSKRSLNVECTQQYPLFLGKPVRLAQTVSTEKLVPFQIVPNTRDNSLIRFIHVGCSIPIFIGVWLALDATCWGAAQ